MKRLLQKFTLTFCVLLLFTYGKKDKLKMFFFKKLKYLFSMLLKSLIMIKFKKYLIFLVNLTKD
jgi:hypothetical protein